MLCMILIKTFKNKIYVYENSAGDASKYVKLKLSSIFPQALEVLVRPPSGTSVLP